ncbi:MAG: prepilin-type N-terminal cleavage/methylation domain-containing protein [Deltaproteobacteria bacterium]|nr:prepilin-type N-terminal cleavage/methylation domain-containing protein [Deltaproteobacteria bacterium]
MLEVKGLRLEAIKQKRFHYTTSRLKRGLGRALLRPDAERASSELCSSSGFTLLEILIAIAILALVVSSLYGAYSGTMETTEMVESARDVDQAARLALMQMVDDFSSLYYKEAEGEDEDSPFRFQGGMDGESEGGTVVEFASTAHLGFDGSFPNLRINRVSYVLEKQADNERYYRLVRMELPFVDLPGEREETAIELADTVESLTVTYLNEDGETLSQWDSKAQETEGILPRLVHIRLQLAGEKSRVFTATVALQAWEEEERQ